MACRTTRIVVEKTHYKEKRDLVLIENPFLRLKSQRRKVPKTEGETKSRPVSVSIRNTGLILTETNRPDYLLTLVNKSNRTRPSFGLIKGVWNLTWIRFDEQE